MLPIFKPLFIYKKYFIANKIIADASKSFGKIVAIVDDNKVEHQMYQKGYLLQFGKYFLPANKDILPERFLESLDLLKSNGHIELFPNDDTYRVTYSCSIEGERAVNDGFYLSKAYKKIAAIITTSIALGTPLGVWLIRKLPLWLG